MLYSFWMTNRYAFTFPSSVAYPSDTLPPSWLLLNFDALGALAVFCTTLLALSGLVSAGIAGLCITSAMSFTMRYIQIT